VKAITIILTPNVVFAILAAAVVMTAIICASYILTAQRDRAWRERTEKYTREVP